jgi:hypothetical protein
MTTTTNQQRKRRRDFQISRQESEAGISEFAAEMLRISLNKRYAAHALPH